MKIIIEDNQLKKEYSSDFVTNNSVNAGTFSRLDLISDVIENTKNPAQSFKSSLVAIDAGSPSKSLIKKIEDVRKSMKRSMNENNIDAGAYPNL